MNLSEQLKQICSSIDEIVGESEFRRFNEEEKKRFRQRYTNANYAGVEIDESQTTLLIPSATWKNWLYYLGMEYLNESEYDTYGGIVVLRNNGEERVEEVFSTIIGNY